MAIARDKRLNGISSQQQAQFDVHYILDDLDFIKNDIHRIADSLEEFAKCVNNKA